MIDKLKMEINLLNYKKIKISGYGKNQFVISGKKYKNPILILKNKVIQKKNLKTKDLKKKFLNDIILKNKLDFLILGIDTKFGKDFYLKRNSKIELMSTSAACRTLNILFSEGRNIGALLFPIN